MDYNQITSMLRSNFGVVGVEAPYCDSRYVIEDLVKTINKALDQPVVVWYAHLGFLDANINKSGLVLTPRKDYKHDNNLLTAFNYIIPKSDAPSIGATVFLMVDLPQYVTTSLILDSAFKELCLELKIRSSSLIVLSENLQDFTVKYQHLIYSTTYPLPTVEKLEEEINWTVKGIEEEAKRQKVTANTKLSKEEKNEVIRAALGQPLTVIQDALLLSASKYRSIDARTSELLSALKAETLKSCGAQIITPPDTEVIGLDNLKLFLDDAGAALDEEARKYKVPLPKGILLIGPPGTGKTLCAKTVAQRWKIPGFQLSMGNLFNERLGKSEANFRQLIRIAESIAPCIIHIDELEKALKGMSGPSTDSGVGARILGDLLSWMSEKTKPVFIVATANSTEGLPPELLRKGRFDEIFYVGLPTKKERFAMLKKYVEKFTVEGATNIDDIALNELSDRTEYFSGAEIFDACSRASWKAYSRRRKGEDPSLLSGDLFSAISSTTPIVKAEPDKFKALTEQASKFMPASSSSDRTEEFTNRFNLLFSEE